MILKNVTKHYGETAALQDVTLQLREGGITAVLGESGAGKTTLLNAIAGLISYEGEIGNGEARPACSYLFQDAKLLPNLTAEENCKFVLDKTQWENIEKMLALVGLQGKEKTQVKHLSGGERQRVAIARAFLYPHELLLMDEPFSSLDLSLKKSLIELVISLWRQQKNTIVFVTHDVHEAALLAQSAVVLKEGRVIFQTDVQADYPRDFFQSYSVEEKLVQTLING